MIYCTSTPLVFVFFLLGSSVMGLDNNLRGTTASRQLKQAQIGDGFIAIGHDIHEAEEDVKRAAGALGFFLADSTRKTVHFIEDVPHHIHRGVDAFAHDIARFADTTGEVIEEGFEETQQAVGNGLHATANVVGGGLHFVADGVEEGLHATGHFVNNAGQSIRLATENTIHAVGRAGQTVVRGTGRFVGKVGDTGSAFGHTISEASSKLEDELHSIWG